MKRKEMVLNNKNKKGVSPVIATVLLIGMVVVLALIVFVWMRALARETITKFDGENIELSCDKVSIDADYSSSSGILTVTNNGNTPIYRLKMKIEEVGRERTEIITEDDQWPKFGIDAGMTYSSEAYALDISGSEEVVLIPVLLGNTDDGKKKTFTCDENFGYKVI